VPVKKTYKVLNPRGIDKGLRILAFAPGGSSGGETLNEWFEGDGFIKPPKMNQTDVDAWVERGFLEVVNG